MKPVFVFDFSSPYAYLAAHRVDDVLPVRAQWRPIAFGPLLKMIGKTPWSFVRDAAHDARRRDCEERAAALGLELRWPEGWPFDSYSMRVLRAAVVAEDAGRLREFSLAAFRHGFGLGRSLVALDAVLEVAEEAGLDAGAVRAGVEDDDAKARVRERTEWARSTGISGVPTVVLGERIFWGDDRLEDAAEALAA